MKIQYHIIIASIIAFFLLNLIENIIHFSIGRGISERESIRIKIKMPEKIDILKIMIIMIIFSILQGLLTYLIDNYIKS